MKKFMTGFSALAAAFGASASLPPQQAAASPALIDAAHGSTLQADGKVTTRDADGNVFNFVLRRSPEQGQLMAWHESHASHASHASHSSHYSSRY